jgi:DNA polymerase III sliding clamp (beta) subunit (PCNA family)
MFDITIEQSVLMKALEFLEPTVGKNANSLGDNCLAMSTTGNGSIEMYTTNTVEFTKLEAIVAIGGNTVEVAPYVDFKRFKGIIASIPSTEMVSIKANVNDLHINYALKKVPIKLVGCNNGMLPLPTNQFPSSTMITIPRVYVSEAINQVSSIITDNDAAPIYNCMRIATSGLSVEFTAVDTTAKRTFVKSIVNTQNNPIGEILLEVSKIKKSLKIFEDYYDLDMYMDQSAIRIDGMSMSSHTPKTKGMISGVTYYTRRLTGAFPTNIKQSFNPLPTEFCEISKEELLNSFTRIKALEDQTTAGQIGFEVTGNSCIITMGSAYGQVEDTITMENTSSKSFKTIFKHQSLSDIMKIIVTDTFEIGVMPNHPTNYIVRGKGCNDVMFTVPTMVAAGNNP